MPLLARPWWLSPIPCQFLPECLCTRTRQVGNRLGPPFRVSGSLGVVCVDTAGQIGWPGALATGSLACRPRDQGGVRLELSQHGGLCCGSRSGCGMMDHPELAEGFVCRTGLLGATLCVLAIRYPDATGTVPASNLCFHVVVVMYTTPVLTT